MNIKKKLIVYLSTLLTFLFLSSSLSILYLDSQYRKIDFENRMKKKGLTYARLLVDVKEINTQLLNKIYKNSNHSLLNEKIIIFNSQKEIIFSSFSQTTINWTKNDLNKIDQENKISRIEKNNEILGFKYFSKNKSYYILISAEDIYGNNHLQFSFYILISIFCVFSLLGIFLILIIVKNTLKDLNVFINKIRIINETNLKNRVQVDEKSKTEINTLGKEFNYMLDRIEKAYQSQREFTAQASHELKTPIARIISQLENLLIEIDESQKIIIYSMINNAVELNELIQSLLILTKIENISKNEVQELRIDEIIDNSISKTCKLFPDFKINFEINPTENIYNLLYVKADKTHLEIVFNNLLKNAYFYSDNQILNIQIIEKNNQLNVILSNTGQTISEKDQVQLFKPFSRGTNTQGKPGLGLGLRIVERILSHNKHKISYQIINQENHFIITF
jgi:two-component system, OmpR family, sensor histidine kinase ArlS